MMNDSFYRQFDLRTLAWAPRTTGLGIDQPRPVQGRQGNYPWPSHDFLAASPLPRQSILPPPPPPPPPPRPATGQHLLESEARYLLNQVRPFNAKWVSQTVKELCQHQPDLAQALLLQALQRRPKDRFFWNQLISLRRNDCKGALDAWLGMRAQGLEPDGVTCSAFIEVCGRAQRTDLAWVLFEYMRRHELPLDLPVLTSLIHIMVQVAAVDQVLYLFNQMFELKISPQLFTCREVLQLLLEQGRVADFERVCGAMAHHGVVYRSSQRPSPPLPSRRPPAQTQLAAPLPSLQFLGPQRASLSGLMQGLALSTQATPSSCMLPELARRPSSGSGADLSSGSSRYDLSWGSGPSCSFSSDSWTMVPSPRTLDRPLGPSEPSAKVFWVTKLINSASILDTVSRRPLFDLELKNLSC